MATPRRRAVGGIRLSSLTEDTTSPARQRAQIKAWADAHDVDIIGWGEDLDVSAEISPWDRPELGPWLNDRADEFDLLVFAKLDRAVRSLNDFVDLDRWAEPRSVYLVILDPAIDMSDMYGRAMGQVFAVFAELERKMIAKRTKEGYDEIVSAGRWAGGRAPFGYRPVRRVGHDGWWLVVDEEQADALRTVIDNVIAGKSIRSQAITLQESGIPTPGGKPKWSPASLSEMLRSRTILGQWQTADGTARDKSGLPIQRAESLISSSTWTQLQETLNASVFRKKGNRSDGSPLLQVVFHLCKAPLYKVESYKNLKSGERRTYTYYRCATYNDAHAESCPNSSFKADELHTIVFNEFLARVGGLEVQERIFVPGEEHTESLEIAQTSYSELTERHATLKPGIAKDTLTKRLSALEEIIGDLEAKPSRPSGWKYEGTGQTYGELWADLSNADRGSMLRESGVRAHVGRGPNGEPIVGIGLPEDLEERAQKWSSGRSGTV